MAEVITETERLRLRTWNEADRHNFYGRMNEPEVMEHLGGVQDFATWSAALDRLLGFQRDFGHSFWIVEERGSREMLGFCGLKRVNAPGGEPLQGQFEIGWRLHHSAWGRGIAKEAAIASLDLAFGRFGAPHVLAFTVVANSASWGLMERLGMTRRADLDFENPRYGPELNPTIVYRIDAADWPSARAAALS
jgi:RimJ/RimL family protein N-acetyltransferase